MITTLVVNMRTAIVIVLTDNADDVLSVIVAMMRMVWVLSMQAQRAAGSRASPAASHPSLVFLMWVGFLGSPQMG